MELNYTDDAITLENEAGDLLAEVDFPEMKKGVVNICHTYVSPALRGQKAADTLLLALADKLRAEGKRAYPTCSYASWWFSQHPEYGDVYTGHPS